MSTIENKTNTNTNTPITPTAASQEALASSSSSPTSYKLRKIPPIPIRRNQPRPEEDGEADVDVSGDEEDDDNALDDNNKAAEDNPEIILASSLGLNHIRTRSLPRPSPLSISSGWSSCNNAIGEGYTSNFKEANAWGQGSHRASAWTEPGRKVSWSQTKSLKHPSSGKKYLDLECHHVAFAKELQSPRFQAILRVTSGRKKKAPDVKSFSHELNSKGVKPFPVWKSRAVGHMEEVLLAIRVKFDKMKDEVDSDLGIFAGDLVGILEKTSESHPEWRERLEDLLVVARHCAKMSSREFWVKCEGIVQILDDKRQELPVGILKQAHTRLLFILTRCSRLVQFQKESGYEEDHILGLHQSSDLGVYPEQILEIAQQDFSGPLGPANLGNEKHQIKQDYSVIKPNELDQQAEVATAKSVDSTSSSFRMSSWKKLPSAAEKNKVHDAVGDAPSKEKAGSRLHKEEAKVGGDEHSEVAETPDMLPSTRMNKAPWGFWGDPHGAGYDNLMICRICEVEIPVVHVEEHSLICTIADRCDLKGLTVDERLARVAETLEKILDSWTPKSTPRGPGSPKESLDVEGGSASAVHEQVGDAHDIHADADNDFAEELNVVAGITCGTQTNDSPEADGKTSSGSLTPRSPLLTPRSSQIELLLTGRRTITELENYQQVSKLLLIAHNVASVNGDNYTVLEHLLDLLEDLKYAIQDRKVDALIVETFGRRIEKLLQEKYVCLCSQIDDERMDSHMADDESSVEDDQVRSLRASPINRHSNDRTSIEDFEIIKPISRGAYGRVFLARKRKTGDLFAIKVLRKSDMIRKNAVESILAERNILISVRNPFVVRFFYSFTCSDNLYLVMEYLNGGDLYSLLRNLGCLDEDMARVYIAELVLALEYLHSLNVVHRDLKPDNLLIGQDGHVKLTDFGLSKVGLIDSTDDLSGPSLSSSGFLDDDKTRTQQSPKREPRKKHAVVGTPDYLAPEILLGMGHGTTADWWSVGVILFELLVGSPPFNADSPQQIFDNIINRDIPWPRVPEDLSFEAWDLIDKLLMENPVQRLGATGAGEVKHHVFFKNINWDTLARQKATFIPSTDAHDTSYFMCRYIWNPEDENNVPGASDFDDMTDSCSTSSFSNTHDEEVDEFGNMIDFGAPTLDMKYSFSNFSFKNLSQLASINYDLVVKCNKEVADSSASDVP